MSSRRGTLLAGSPAAPCSAPSGLAALVISLRRTPARTAAALAQLAAIGLPVSVVWATDGRDRAALESAATAPGHHLQPGEVGLFDSWFRCAAHIVRHNLAGAVVFEDDAEEVRPGALNALSELPANADFALLHDADTPTPTLADGCTENFLAVSRCSWQTCAVYLTNSGARELLKSLPIEKPVDAWFRDSGLKGFQCRPGKGFYRQTFMWPSEVRENGGAGKIPKAIHQIWIGDKLPDEFAAYAAEWRRLHPDFEYRLWDGNSILSEWPNEAHTMARCGTPAAKSDYARLLILEKYGGLYADTDFQPFKNFAEPIRAASFLFGWMDHQSISNGFLASIPAGAVITEMITEARARIRLGLPILEAAGPALTLSIIKPRINVMGKPLRDGIGTAYGDTGVVGLAPHVLFPYTWTQPRPATYPESAWAAHHWARSWWTPEMWGSTSQKYA